MFKTISKAIQRGTLAAGIGLLALAAAPAEAALMYAADGANFTVNPNQTATVIVSLVEVSGSQLSAPGLQSASVVVDRDAGSLPANPSAITGQTLNTSGFNGATSINPSDPGDLNVSLAVATGSSSGPTGPNIQLLTLQITGGSTPGVTTFDLVDDPLFDETIAFPVGTGPTLDGLIAVGSFTVTVVPIPEPASAALFALTPLAALLRRRRCR